MIAARNQSLLYRCTSNLSGTFIEYPWYAIFSVLNNINIYVSNQKVKEVIPICIFAKIRNWFYICECFSKINIIIIFCCNYFLVEKDAFWIHQENLNRIDPVISLLVNIFATKCKFGCYCARCSRNAIPRGHWRIFAFPWRYQTARIFQHSKYRIIIRSNNIEIYREVQFIVFTATICINRINRIIVSKWYIARAR